MELGIKINIKGILKVTTLSPIFITFVALSVNWVYLNKLGRLDVFIESVTFKELFFIIATFLFISTLLISAILFMPSLLLSVLLKEKNSMLYNYPKIKLNYIKAFTITSLVAIIVFYFSSWMVYKQKVLGGVAFSLAAIFVFFIAMTLCYLMNKRLINESLQHKNLQVRKKQLINLNLYIPASLFMATFAYFSLLTIVFNKTNIQEGFSEEIQLFYLTTVSLFFAMFSILPGFFYLTESENANIFERTFSISGAMLFSMLAMSLIITPIPVIIIHATMKLSGISDYNNHYYIFDKKNYPEEIFDKIKWKYSLLRDNEKASIYGANIFSFGYIKLVCPSEVLEHYNRSMKSNLLEMDHDKKLNEALAEKAKECIPFKKDEVKEVNGLYLKDS
ncbi:hypothetical protein [Dickeya lacustris]|uniref:Uncharacterized protein n=1 Tax=Dickeya lacustris TaxID=2259638 RepID=A0ABY8G772_9GAMM|nr:hypothetical protein [Dickeya lacustris]WFN55805.1 hypothetical protein O1Q98_00245 [Dickeya lacustris]